MRECGKKIIKMCIACYAPEVTLFAIVATAGLVGGLIARQFHPLAVPIGVICAVEVLFYVMETVSRRYTTENKKEE